MKIVFMGTPEFAVPALERLVESPHEVVLVVTQPSKPQGRGQKVVDPPVKQVADQHGIEVIQPASLKKEPIHERVRQLAADIIVVVAYGKILPDELLAAPRLGCLNIHASLLPEYRGAAPIQRAIMDGRRETGVTIMKLAAELDAGPIVSQQTIDIMEDDDSLSVGNMLSVLGADMLIRALDDIEKSGRIEAVEQDASQATYAAMIKKEEGEIDWSIPSDEIMYRLRALTPWPGLFTTISAKRVRIVQAEPLDSAEAEHHGASDKAPPGTVTAIMKGFGFVVRTGSGHLLVTRVQPAGKPMMDATAFLNGNPLEVGQALDRAPALKR